MARDLKLQVILDAVDRATGPLKNITRGSGKTAEAIRASKEQLRDLNRQQKDVRSYREARWAMRGNERAIRELTEQTEQYTREQAEQKGRHERVQTSLKNARREYDRLAKAVENATEPNAQLSNELDKARIRLNSQQQAADRSSDELKRYRERIRQANDKVERLNATHRTHQDRLTGIKRRLEDAGVSTNEMARAARELRGQEERLNDTLEKQRKRLESIKDVRERLSRIRGRGATVLDNGRNLAAGAGVAGGMATAVVGGLSHNFATNGEEVRQWAARLGLAADQLSRLQYAGSQFGVQDDAMIDALKELSLRTDEFTKTGKGGGAEAFERLGLSPEQLDAASNDTAQLFDLVLGRLREVQNVAARQRIVDELFGGQGGEQLAELAGASADEIRRLLDEADALGFTLGAQDTQAAQDYMRAWRGATGALAGVRNILGRELAPELADLFRQFSDWVKTNRDQVQQFAKDFRNGLRDVLPLIVDTVKGLADFARTSATIVQRIAALVGGFDNLAIIMATLFASRTIGSVLSLATALGGLAGGGKAMRGLGKAMQWTGRQARGPLIGALKGVCRALGGLTLGLRAFGAILWAVSKGITLSLISALKKLGIASLSAAGRLMIVLGGALKAVGRAALFAGRAVLVGLLGALKATAVFLATNPVGWAIMAIAGAAYLIYQNWDKVGPWLAEQWEGIKEKGAALWQWFQDAPGNAIEAVATMLDDWDLKGTLEEKWDEAIDYLRSLPGRMRDAGLDVARGLGEGIKNGASAAWEAVSEAATGTERMARYQLDTHSPSRVFKAIGGDVMAGLAQGIHGAERDPLGQIAAFSQRLRGAGAGLALGAATLPAVATADVPIDTRPPLSAAAGGGLTIQGGINIEINASPGMDERALARLVNAEVQRAIEAASRDAAARRRSSFYDID